MVGYDSQIPGMTIKWDEFVKAALLNTKYYDMKSKLGKTCGIAQMCGGTVLIYAGIFFVYAYFKCACLCVCYKAALTSSNPPQLESVSVEFGAVEPWNATGDGLC